MKKNILIAVLALGTLTFVSSCGTKSDNGSENTGAPEATLAEENVGTDPATVSDNVETVASQTEDKGVVELTDDAKYRPSTKVDRLTILDFNATWCGPCKQFAPAFHSAAEKFGDNVTFVSVDVDKNPSTASAFGVQSIPTVIFLSPSGKTQKYVGTEDLLPESKFVALVQGAM